MDGKFNLDWPRGVDDSQLVYVGKEEGKLLAVRQMIQAGLTPPVMIFVQSIERAKELFGELVYDGINVDVIHSERTQVCNGDESPLVYHFVSGRWFSVRLRPLVKTAVNASGCNSTCAMP